MKNRVILVLCAVMLLSGCGQLRPRDHHDQSNDYEKVDYHFY